MEQMESMETSVKDWANGFEQICKQNSTIKEHEIYIEACKSDKFRCQIDRRGRWNGRPIPENTIRFQFSCSIILEDGKQAQKQYFSQLQRSPEQVVKELIQKATFAKGIIAEKQKYHHLNLETWDPRYPRMKMEQRIELFEWNINTLRNLNKNVRIKYYELIEEEHASLYHSTFNANRFEKYTMFYFKGELHDAITGKVHTPCISSHRFADISSEILGVASFGKKANQSKFSKSVRDDFLLILPSAIVKEIANLLYPAFDLELLQNGKSFLAGKQGERIGSDKVHLLDNALLPSGYNSRSFDSKGYPPRVLTLINEGIFQDYYVPHRTVTNFPTGHLGFDGKLSVGNLLVHNGRRSQNMVLADLSMALYATELQEPITLDIKTGRIRIVSSYQVVSSNGFEGELGIKEINCNCIDLLKLVMETTNDQKRTTFIDSSSWVLENCSLFIS